MIDVGCNLAPFTPRLGYKHRKYVDILPRTLDHPEEQKFFEQNDLLAVLRHGIAYNTVISSDVIEHLTTDRGYEMLALAENCSHRQIIFTPLGPWMLEPDGPSPEQHHSAWYPEMLEGYASIVFPNYHPTLGVGAFFSWKCDDLEADFARVKQELRNKPWAIDWDKSKELAGVTFIRNAIEFDYHIIETIKSLLECCDHVFVVDAGSDDGTSELLSKFWEEANAPLDLIHLRPEDWFAQQGREKLSYFTNIAIEAAQKRGFEWVLYVQADEILHESSYEWARRAIQRHPEDDGILCTRHNLWGDSQHRLNVPQAQKPCSTEVIRLAKSHCRAVGDAESLNGQCKWVYDEEIVIFHTGFGRDKYKMIPKIKNMQVAVFQMGGYDPTLDQMADGFDPWINFSPEDVVKISGSLPKLIQDWANDRDKKNKTDL